MTTVGHQRHGQDAVPLRNWPIDWDLSGSRARLRRVAAEAGLPESRVGDLLIAANEAVVGTLEHGGGEGAVAVWHDEHMLTVQVADHRPGPRTPEHVLWVMRQICDEFSVESEPGRRVIRLGMRLSKTL